MTNPECWTDEFLKYDYIGAPWWYAENNVGNGGFSLRSANLIKFLQDHKDEYPVTTNADDDLLCRSYRPRLEQEGFKWAPEELAHQFAFERVRKAPKSFGFHGTFNWPLVLNDDQMMERLMILQKDPYAKKTGMLSELYRVLAGEPAIQTLVA